MRSSYDGPRLLSLRVRHLRNVRSLRLVLDSDADEILLTGPNGAGKTTILEAIYLLARGRSFRGRKAGPLTTEGESRTLIEGRFTESDGDGESVVVFERTDRGTERRINGIPFCVGTPQDNRLRVKLVAENPQALLEGEPTLRRSLLDWNLFHVEHRLGRLRMELRRVLAQRNLALRSRGPGPSAWDPSFVDISERITEKRESFVRAWRSHFRALGHEFQFLAGCDLVFERGWPVDRPLPEILAESRVAETQRGQTLVGPHRADIRISRGGVPMRFSRGQAKIVVCLLQLAAERVHRAEGLHGSLWLLDDLEAEVDEDTARRLRGLFDATGCQRLFTRVRSAASAIADASPLRSTMFHVEHGRLRMPITDTNENWPIP
jgi:DNA replication and repair protein RecF